MNQKNKGQCIKWIILIICKAIKLNVYIIIQDFYLNKLKPLNFNYYINNNKVNYILSMINHIYLNKTVYHGISGVMEYQLFHFTVQYMI